jgi:thiol-disulfide isomerase/thioredoxin
MLLVACVVAFAALDSATRYVRGARERAEADRPVVFMERPFELPAFTAKDLDGNEVTLESWRGRITLVNFWATWCAPCRTEMPGLAALQAKYADRLRVVGVLYDDAPMETVRAMAASLGVNYQIVVTSHEIERSFSEPLALPMTYLVDPQGRIVVMHAGLVDLGLVEREFLELDRRTRASE